MVTLRSVIPTFRTDESVQEQVKLGFLLRHPQYQTSYRATVKLVQKRILTMK